MKSSTDGRLTGIDVLNKHSNCEPFFTDWKSVVLRQMDRLKSRCLLVDQFHL